MAREMSAAAFRAEREDGAVRHWSRLVSEAACMFETRWTLRSLRRANADLADALQQQLALFADACVRGTGEDVEIQGGAMCRGWQAAVRCMEQAGAEDDAYQIGRDPKTGYTVAIGEQRAAAARVREIHGERVVWLTPDEVASLMAATEGLKMVGAIKAAFPGAEIIDRYPDVPRVDMDEEYEMDGVLEPADAD